MKLGQQITGFLTVLAVSVIPSLAHASQGGTWMAKWEKLLTRLFGASRGGGSLPGTSPGPSTSGVPELGGEGFIAALVIVLAIVAIVMDRRRRAAPARA